MAGFQQLIVSGNLAKDPETKFTTNGAQVTEISIAVSEKYKNKTTGETVESTEWFNISYWNKQAEVISQYLAKGSGVTCICKIKTDEWDDNGQKRTAKKFQGLSFTFVGGQAGGQQGQQNQAQNNQNQNNRQPNNGYQNQPSQNVGNDSIPF